MDIYIISGVSQGSIMYTNDIVKNIERDILLFADDTSILLYSMLSITKVNRDLERLSNWVSQWLIQFNPTKKTC